MKGSRNEAKVERNQASSDDGIKWEKKKKRIFVLYTTYTQPI